jgi:DHA1 family bicyclomycin/chloramphenicol resistance-like MFS transporter
LNAAGVIGAGQLNRQLLLRYTPEQVLKAASLAGVAASALLLLAAFTGWGGMWSVLPLIFLVLSSYGFMAGNTMAGALNVDPRRAGSISALMGSASFATGALASALTGALGDGSARPVAVTMFLAMTGSALALRTLALKGTARV